MIIIGMIITLVVIQLAISITAGFYSKKVGSSFKEGFKDGFFWIPLLFGRKK